MTGAVTTDAATGAAVLACVVLAALAGFQLALALGAPWGRFAWGGQHERELPRPLRIASAASIVLYGLFAALLLDRARLVDLLPDTLSRVGTWVLVGYLALGVVMNGISRSRSERMVMTPTVVVLLVCAVVVARSPL